MEPPANVVFETPRLVVRAATPEDAVLFLALWTDGRIMGNMGFPHGLRVTREEIEGRLEKQDGTEFDRLLVVVERETGRAIGECFMHRAEAGGATHTDIKLLPETWGRGYGSEVKRGLLRHLFSRTDCAAVEATPNVGNTASIRMQEAVGGVRVGESVHEFPEAMRGETTPVHHYVYRVTRETWEAREGAGERGSGNGTGSGTE
jgi:RimJ/RimL family protein N-acetyltransferase